MVLCPVALAVHCTSCPIVRVCPAKTIIGDYGKRPPAPGSKGGKREIWLGKMAGWRPHL